MWAFLHLEFQHRYSPSINAIQCPFGMRYAHFTPGYDKHFAFSPFLKYYAFDLKRVVQLLQSAISVATILHKIKVKLCKYLY